jgi:hypothetical protein
MVTLHRYRNWKLEVFGREHGIPHVHVSGPEFDATVSIATGEVLAGTLPAATLRDVQDWLATNSKAAMQLWHQRNPKR